VQGGQGQAPARQAQIKAGIDSRVGAVAINKVCGSGLKAVMLGAQAIKAGDAHCVVAGGQESMSTAPHYLFSGRTGQKLGDTTLKALAKLPAVTRDKSGMITAGNAPGLNDGGAAVVLMSGERAEQSGMAPLARVVAYATGGGEPKDLFFAPIDAVQKLMRKMS